MTPICHCGQHIISWLTESHMFLTFWTLGSGLGSWQGEEGVHWPSASLLIVHGPLEPQCLIVSQILGEGLKVQGEILVLFLTMGCGAMSSAALLEPAAEWR